MNQLRQLLEEKGLSEELDPHISCSIVISDNEIMINGVRIRIPPKVDPSTANHALELALHAARNGIGEGNRAIGFLIVLASKSDYEDPNFGYVSHINRFNGNGLFSGHELILGYFPGMN